MNEPKIYYMGKPVRDRKGKFTKRRWIKVGMTAAAFVLILTIGANKYGTKEIIAVASEIPPQVAFAGVTMESKVEAMKDQIVEELAQCESGNAPQETAIVKYDNNSKGTLKGKHIASIGVMQFKVETVQQFYRQLHNVELSNYDATLLALDNTKAKQLAKESILKIKGALWHWTCATQDMATRVEIIRELEQ